MPISRVCGVVALQVQIFKGRGVEGGQLHYSRVKVMGQGAGGGGGSG